MSITIMLNGQRETLSKPLSLESFIDQQGYRDMKVAVARNGMFVARNDYKTTHLNDGDDVEIVAPMQGG